MHDTDIKTSRFLKLFMPIRRLFKVTPKVSSQTSQQFIGTLETTFHSIPHDSAEPNQIAGHIKKLLAVKENEDVWPRAYKIERLMPNLFSGGQLRTELLRRIDEAKKTGASFANFYEGQVKIEDLDELDAASGQSGSKYRAILLRLIGDLQWLYNARYVKRSYSRVAGRRVTTIFILAFLIFVIAILHSGRGIENMPITKPNTSASTTDSNLYRIQSHGKAEN